MNVALSSLSFGCRVARQECVTERITERVEECMKACVEDRVACMMRVGDAALR
jgi:hypothetical protein